MLGPFSLERTDQQTLGLRAISRRLRERRFEPGLVGDPRCEADENERHGCF
jgi:hypothetical protein